MLLVSLKKKGVKVAVVSKKQEKMTTNIACGYNLNILRCTGFFVGHYDELEKVWIFRCNKCGREAGRGKIEKEGKKA